MFPQSHPPKPKRRSITMLEHLRIMGYQVTTQGDELYILVNGQNYRILDGNVIRFDKPLISIDAGVSNREMICFDPATTIINDLYEELVLQLQQNKKKDIVTVLNTSMDLVRSWIYVDNEEKLHAFCQDTNNQMALYNKTIPVLSLDTFIDNNIGVCRHHSIFISYILQRLISDGYLPPGNVFHHRFNVPPNNAHAWSMYKPTEQVPDDYTIYLVDTLWSDRAYDFSKNINELIELGYGEEAIKDCIHRYKLNLKSTPFRADYPPQIKSEFLKCLLDLSVNSAKRQEYLNYQYALNHCVDLKEHVEMLKKNIMTSPFPHCFNFKAFNDELDLVLKTDALHTMPYSECKDHDKPQFITGLLFKSSDERQKILAHQSMTDLEQINQLLINKNSLNADKQIVCEQILKEDIPKCIHLKTMTLIKEIILSGELEVSSDSKKKSSSALWKPGKKIGDIRVSTSCKEIYDKLIDPKLATADFSKIQSLIFAIQKIATTSNTKKQKNAEDKSDNKKHEFFSILSQTNNPSELFKALEHFQKTKIASATPVVKIIIAEKGPSLTHKTKD